MKAKAHYSRNRQQQNFISNLNDMDEIMQEENNVMGFGMAPPQQQQAPGGFSFGSSAPTQKNRRKINPRKRSDLAITGIRDKEYKFYGSRVVPEGARLLVWSESTGHVTAVDGPSTAMLFRKTTAFAKKFTATANEYLEVRLRNGDTNHIPGPVSIFYDPLTHEHIEIKDTVKLGTNEAIVVFCRDLKEKDAEAGEAPLVGRKIIIGPNIRVPQPEEWTQEFTWGADESGNAGESFARLRLVPEQVFVTVEEVRTSDDVLLDFHFRVTFQLENIELMIENTTDPIQDIKTGLCADVIQHFSTKSFADVSETTRDHSVETYKILGSRCKANGIAIRDIAFRGAQPTQKIKQLQEANAQQRIKLTLEAETEAKRQHMKGVQVRSQIELKQAQMTAELDIERQSQLHKLEIERMQNQAKQDRNSVQAAINKQQNEVRLAFIEGLKAAGVDVTAYLVAELEASKPTAPDYKLEVVGNNGSTTTPHVHLNAAEK